MKNLKYILRSFAFDTPVSLRGAKATKQSNQKDCFDPSGLAMTPIAKVLILLALILFLCAFDLAAVEKDDEDDDGEIQHQHLLKVEELTRVLQSIRNPFASQLPEPPPPPAGSSQRGTQLTNPQNLDPSNQRTAVTLPSDYERMKNQGQVGVVTGIDVTGIVWNSKRPQAIVNNKVVSVGDKVNDYEVKAIKKSGVILKFSGQTIKIKIKK